MRTEACSLPGGRHGVSDPLFFGFFCLVWLSYLWCFWLLYLLLIGTLLTARVNALAMNGGTAIRMARFDLFYGPCLSTRRIIGVNALTSVAVTAMTVTTSLLP